MKYFFYLITALILANLLSCDTTEPPKVIIPEQPKAITLQLLDVSCTEAFIKVTAADTVLPVSLTITKDEKHLFSFMLTKQDTVITDTTLHPNTTYTYQTEAEINGKTEESEILQVTTLNITSSNFTWEKYEFGGIGGSSDLYDVAIINENDIWAVGRIYADTTGKAYNAVHWNGSEWELKRIMFKTICGQQKETPYPASAIWASDNKEIWIAMDGDQIAKIENGNQTITLCLPWSFSIRKIWGISKDDFYVVGDNGNIAHYQAGNWSKIESGTTTDLNDIWGYYDVNTQRSTVLAAVSELFQGEGERRLLSIDEHSVRDTLGSPFQDKVSGVWFKNNYSPVYISGNGVKEYKHQKWQKYSLSTWLMKIIRGNNTNDIFAVDGSPTVFHYNGINWEKVKEFPGSSINGIAVKDDIVVLAGSQVRNFIVGSATVIIGKRK